MAKDGYKEEVRMKILNIAAIIAISYSSSIQATDLIEIGYQFMESKNIECRYIPDITEIKYGNITVYSIVCENEEEGTEIYEYAPKQLVHIYHID